MSQPLLDRLAVCSWSLQPETPRQLADALRQIELRKLQIALDTFLDAPTVWDPLRSWVANGECQLVSGMFGCVGEDYSTLESIRRTGGIVPEETWAANWDRIQKLAPLAKTMGLALVTFHAGFLPHDESDPAYRRLLERLRLVAKTFAASGVELALETGQETAETLRGFLASLDCSNVGVNFDPANMILYDKGDPIEALRVLAPFLKQCHIKDAKRAHVPGVWGEEVAVGAGEVHWRAFFQTLDELKFSGSCAIEREAGNRRIEDIQTARRFVQSL